MTWTAQDIITRANDLLFDPNNIRWTTNEHLRWISDGQRQIVTLRPDLGSVIEAIPLVAGAKQTLPTGGQRLEKLIRNMGANGTTPGRAITLAEFDDISQYNPLWPAGTPSATILNYLYDDRMPTVFWIYPPASTPTYVEAHYVKTPADVTSTSTNLTIPEAYYNALLDYVVAKALSKDSDAGNMTRASAFAQSFNSFFEAKVQIDAAVSPNTSGHGAVNTSQGA